MVLEEFGVRLLGWENIREAALMGLETSLNHLRMETELGHVFLYRQLK